MKTIVLIFASLTMAAGYCHSAIIDSNVATLRLPEDVSSEQVTIAKGRPNVTIKVIGYWSETSPISFNCLKFGTKVQLEMKNLFVYRHGLLQSETDGIFTSANCDLNVNGKLLLNENTLTIVP